MRQVSLRTCPIVQVPFQAWGELPRRSRSLFERLQLTQAFNLHQSPMDLLDLARLMQSQPTPSSLRVPFESDSPSSALRSTCVSLHARFYNLRNGSPVYLAWDQERLVGAAFLLRPAHPLPPMSWQDLTDAGTFLRDHPQGPTLVCPQLVSVLSDPAVYARLMEGVVSYAMQAGPSARANLQVWSPMDDSVQCAFHRRYCTLADAHPHSGYSLQTSGGPIWAVYDYAPLLDMLSQPPPVFDGILSARA